MISSSYRKQTQIANVIHAVQVLLALGAIGICAYRMLTKSIRKSRSDMMALGAGAKTLIIICYIVSTENIKSLHRFGNLTAYMVLNIVEMVFWGAVAAMGVKSMLRICQGIACTLSGVTVGLAVGISMLAGPLVLLSVMQWRTWKKTGVKPHDEIVNAKDFGNSPSATAQNSQEDDREKAQYYQEQAMR